MQCNHSILRLMKLTKIFILAGTCKKGENTSLPYGMPWSHREGNSGIAVVAF
jgi:hypothetical protein